MTSIEDIDWTELERQATDILSRYIQIDTTNPPGNEGKAARFLSDTLAGDGVEAALYESAPSRANLVARLKATPLNPPLRRGDSGGSVLLLHHMDVVTASSGAWTYPPFSGAVEDGYIWGRGAIDDKGLGTIHLMAFLLLKRLGVPLKRDVILMAVADEEEGGYKGAKWMIDNHWPEIECEYVWDEGGTGSLGVMGKLPVFAISVWEKRSAIVTLRATGGGGHGSMSSGSALDRLIRALSAIQGYRPQIRFNDVTRDFFEQVSYTQPPLAAWMMRHAEYPIIKTFIAGQIGKIPRINAMLRDTLTATIVKAGDKANVAPDMAEAVLDARLLPDTDQEAFLDEIRRVINDDSVTVEATDSLVSGPPSPTDSDMFGALENAIETHAPDAIITPMQTPVATDSRFFRERGVKAYGLLPLVLSREELATIHGADERMSTEKLTQGIRIALDALVELCGKT